MARFLSQVVTIMRGSVGGITYTANQFHQLVARARTAPVQPNTTPQTIARNSMSGAADAWNQLTEGEQNSWDSYAGATPYPGPLGPYTVSGRDIFVAMKQFRLYLLNQMLIAPSGPETAPAPLSGFYNISNFAPADFAPASSTGVSVGFSAEKTVDAAWMVSISPGFPPARKRYKGPWFTPSAKAGILVKDTSVIVDFDGLVADARYFLRLRAVSDAAPGRISPEFIVNAIAVTNGP